MTEYEQLWGAAVRGFSRGFVDGVGFALVAFCVGLCVWTFIRVLRS
jgi:hypothetical protein